ncbi:hypothetical protein E2C01_042987 [Portunus trituberculatus]|uniref:Uncharacterized protein n=1 Tax=Portunus trituberculatus TaxID=210409 RepID=A0A5B7FRQ1_PORTR|nr:hypothetical protein [Portunus trituberculatus]
MRHITALNSKLHLLFLHWPRQLESPVAAWRATETYNKFTKKTPPTINGQESWLVSGGHSKTIVPQTLSRRRRRAAHRRPGDQTTLRECWKSGQKVNFFECQRKQKPWLPLHPLKAITEALQEALYHHHHRHCQEITTACYTFPSVLI